MFENFQPWVNYTKLIELQAKGNSFRLLRTESKKVKYQQPIVRQKKKSIKQLKK